MADKLAGKGNDGPAASAGPGSVGAFVFDAVQAQQRTLELGRGWSEGILGTLQEQAATYGTLLHSVDASLRAMEKALVSQADTTRALTESLEAARRVVDSAMSAQERTIGQVEAFLGGMLGMLTGQLQALRTRVEAGEGLLAGPVSAQSALLLAMTQDWMDAYGRLLAAAPAAFGRGEAAKPGDPTSPRRSPAFVARD